MKSTAERKMVLEAIKAIGEKYGIGPVRRDSTPDNYKGMALTHNQTKFGKGITSVKQLGFLDYCNPGCFAQKEWEQVCEQNGWTKPGEVWELVKYY